MKKNYNHIVRNLILILLVFGLSSCQTPRTLFQSKEDLLGAFKRSLKPNVQKVDYTEKTKIIKTIDDNNINENKKQKNDEKKELGLNTQKKHSADHNDRTYDKFKNVNKYFEIQKFIGKDDNAIILIIGKPDLKIRHGLTTNYQYHLKKCHVDLFFVNSARKLILKSFDFRASKVKKLFKKSECKKNLIDQIVK